MAELLRGGQFLVKETKCEDVFTPEDFSEEQLMMKEAVKEFNEREIIAHKDRFEAKDYKLTEEVMRKAGELGFLGVAVPEAYGGMGMGFVSTMLTCEYISSWKWIFKYCIWSTYGYWHHANYFVWYRSAKTKICNKISNR